MESQQAYTDREIRLGNAIAAFLWVFSIAVIGGLVVWSVTGSVTQ